QITDLKSRLEEAKKIYGADREKIESHTTLFAQQHNRELQSYWCLEGLIIMEDLSETSVAVEPSEGGLSLETVLSMIDGICGYQSAYLSSSKEAVLVSKDILFVLGGARCTACIVKVDAQGYLSEK
ncbi:hypothetical protein PENTCL1PPCAC_29628, partial [Pristionchus entomophagus]